VEEREENSTTLVWCPN